MDFNGHMRLLFGIIILFFGISHQQYGQFLIPGEGIMDVKLGADWDEIEWELGFKGKKVEKEKATPSVNFIAQQAGIEFDFVVRYQHIMWLPVSDLYFKEGKVNLIVLSSYPEYYQMLCADIGTTEGLNFWNNTEDVKRIYGVKNEVKSNDESYFFYRKKGLGVELLENEVRSMFIFPAQMK